MGLDMYLERMPRYGNTTPDEISAIENYMDWRRQKENKTYNGTMEKWCGISYDKVPKDEILKFYKEHCKFGYAYWDIEKKYSGRYRIIEEVGYWRKANQIHNWFVENVQDGIDDCSYHNEVTKEILEELLDICQRVLDGCELVKTAAEIAKLDHIHVLIYIGREVYWDVGDNGISYQRAICLLRRCVETIDEHHELCSDVLEDLYYAGFNNDEIDSLGYGYLLDVEEEGE